jgi:vacuolar iron transporter family protein
LELDERNKFANYAPLWTSSTKTLEHEHSVEAIRTRLAAGPSHNYLRDWIYGGIDGAVTTFAVVSGVAGARLSAWIILALGVANLFADGFSMAASNFLGTQAEHDDRHRLEAIEQRHIDVDPEGELEEVKQIFQLKGFNGQDNSNALSSLSPPIVSAGSAPC